MVLARNTQRCGDRLRWYGRKSTQANERLVDAKLN
jgi:hypothetical protein